MTLKAYKQSELAEENKKHRSTIEKRIKKGKLVPINVKVWKINQRRYLDLKPSQILLESDLFDDKD